MDPNGNGKRGLPRLKEIIRRQRQDSDPMEGASGNNETGDTSQEANPENPNPVPKKTWPELSSSTGAIRKPKPESRRSRRALRKAKSEQSRQKEPGKSQKSRSPEALRNLRPERTSSPLRVVKSKYGTPGGDFVNVQNQQSISTGAVKDVKRQRSSSALRVFMSKPGTGDVKKVQTQPSTVTGPVKDVKRERSSSPLRVLLEKYGTPIEALKNVEPKQSTSPVRVFMPKHGTAPGPIKRVTFPRTRSPVRVLVSHYGAPPPGAVRKVEPVPTEPVKDVKSERSSSPVRILLDKYGTPYEAGKTPPSQQSRPVKAKDVKPGKSSSPVRILLDEYGTPYEAGKKPPSQQSRPAKAKDVKPGKSSSPIGILLEKYGTPYEAVKKAESQQGRPTEAKEIKPGQSSLPIRILLDEYGTPYEAVTKAESQWSRPMEAKEVKPGQSSSPIGILLDKYGTPYEPVKKVVSKQSRSTQTEDVRPGRSSSHIKTLMARVEPVKIVTVKDVKTVESQQSSSTKDVKPAKGIRKDQSELRTSTGPARKVQFHLPPPTEAVKEVQSELSTSAEAAENVKTGWSSSTEALKQVESDVSLSEEAARKVKEQFQSFLTQVGGSVKSGSTEAVGNVQPQQRDVKTEPTKHVESELCSTAFGRFMTEPCRPVVNLKVGKTDRKRPPTLHYEEINPFYRPLPYERSSSPELPKRTHAPNARSMRMAPYQVPTDSQRPLGRIVSIPRGQPSREDPHPKMLVIRSKPEPEPSVDTKEAILKALSDAGSSTDKGLTGITEIAESASGSHLSDTVRESLDTMDAKLNALSKSFAELCYISEPKPVPKVKPPRSRSRSRRRRRKHELSQLERNAPPGCGTDCPDLEFIYDDTDSHSNEIAELYSYTEQPELAFNVKAFEEQMEQYHLPPCWQRLSLEQRRSVVMKLLDQLEVSNKPMRMRAARCILYLVQGCWAEMQSDAEQQQWARANAMLLYQLGVFSAFTDLLNIEIENSAAAHVAMRKIAVSLADSQDLRVILSVLYTITEVIRNEKDSGSTEYQDDVDSFCTDLGFPDDELLVIKLLGMVTRFCSGAAPHFPMKKVLLLLWKLILVTLGGMTALKDLKDEKREKAGLPRLDEDTMEIARTMRASSPPANASDLLEAQNQKRNTRPFRRNLMKQSSLDDHESLGMELDASLGGDNGDDLSELSEFDERRPDNPESNQMYSNYPNRPASPPVQASIVIPRGLPWKPKVRQKDIDLFLDNARQKFVGYSLQGDRDSLAGLPLPIHEGVKTLKEHVYVSLAELQVQKEEEMARNPLSTSEGEVDLTPTEILYQAMLPNLPQYMIALLKILLAAAPTSKAKTESINIMADVLPEEMPMTVLQSMKLGIDVNRHKEIIVKAVSAILLLLLKHFKLNHIYQFEFMSQHLVFANCIPLVLKFFNQNIMAYVGAKNVIPILDFPSCVIGDQPELTAESLEIGDAAPFSWRNMFSCINLLRILNKLTKWKHSRIMMLVVFKSAPILKRTLKVRHAMTQLYVLKLLKMQTKYLGRQWRKSNMKTISAIYQKVRHRLNDDWAYGNDLDARPWDFQAEECALRTSVDRFNNRRYSQSGDGEFSPMDNCFNSVLGSEFDLSESFKRHYQLWLEQEVFGESVDWERLLRE